MPQKFRFMRWISFLSRVAFICNLAFLFSVLLQWKPFISSQVLLSTVVIIGYFLAPFIFSPIVSLLYVIMLLQKKKFPASLPGWLISVNFVFLLVQLIFVLFFLHDPFH